MSQELRTGTDGYVDVLDIDVIWGKDLKHRIETDQNAFGKTSQKPLEYLGSRPKIPAV